MISELRSQHAFNVFARLSAVAIDDVLKVQVVATGVAGMADRGDGLPLADCLAALDQIAGVVRVQRFHAVAMGYDDHLIVAMLFTRKQYLTGFGRTADLPGEGGRYEKRRLNEAI